MLQKCICKKMCVEKGSAFNKNTKKKNDGKKNVENEKRKKYLRWERIVSDDINFKTCTHFLVFFSYLPLGTKNKIRALTIIFFFKVVFFFSSENRLLHKNYHIKNHRLNKRLTRRILWFGIAIWFSGFTGFT